MTRPGRPKVPVISRREAIAAALEIIDTQGLDKLSMRSLGAAVGVQGMSLYNHFRDKEDILDQVAALIVEDIGVPDPPRAGAGTITTDELAAWSLESATQYRQALLAHPNAIPLFVKGYPTRGRHAVFAREFEVFAEVGIDPRYWLGIVRALELSVGRVDAVPRARPLAGSGARERRPGPGNRTGGRGAGDRCRRRVRDGLRRHGALDDRAISGTLQGRRPEQAGAAHAGTIPALTRIRLACLRRSRAR